MSKSKILFFMSGSIAAFKAAQAISRLVQQGHSVQVVTTAHALKFIGTATLEGLTGRPVLSDLWQEGHAMDHIQLTRWADVAVLCPASANTLAKIASGMADDLVTAMTLAWPMEKPFHIFPAMNSVMLMALPTQQNFERLKARGFIVATTGAGALACGENGEGRLLDPEEIVQTLTATPARAVQKLGRVLVTSGATREPIDGIRFISNVSTGQTGATLAQELSNRGWQITYMHGQAAEQPTDVAHRVSFGEFADLERKLRAELDQRDYAAVIHCAAVSDYSPANAQRHVKLASDQPLTLQLQPNPKLLPRLKAFSRTKTIQVIGFKLTLNATDDENQARARDLLSPSVDAIVGNDWAQVDADRRRHPGQLYQRESSTTFQTLPELAQLLHMQILAQGAKT